MSACDISVGVQDVTTICCLPVAGAGSVSTIVCLPVPGADLVSNKMCYDVISMLYNFVKSFPNPSNLAGISKAVLN